MHWLDYLIIATYIAQIYQVCFYAVPSAGSTAEMLSNRKNKSMAAGRHPGASIVHSVPQMACTIAATLAVLFAAMIPLLTVVFPAGNRHLLPFMKIPPSTGLSVVSAGLLLLGNTLTFIGVAALRANVRFHPFGEAASLHTDGIYSRIRNPITLGLGIIFGGFVLARPSGVMLIGLLIFALNSRYRIHMEEIYLQRAFGDDYLRYKNRVGKYIPKVGRSSEVKRSSIKEANMNPHRGGKKQL